MTDNLRHKDGGKVPRRGTDGGKKRNHESILPGILRRLCETKTPFLLYNSLSPSETLGSLLMSLVMGPPAMLPPHIKGMPTVTLGTYSSSAPLLRLDGLGVLGFWGSSPQRKKARTYDSPSTQKRDLRRRLQ